MIPLRTEERTRNIPYMNWALIVLNIVVFIYQIRMGQRLEIFIEEFSIIPKSLWLSEDPKGFGYFYPYRTLLTATFLHGGIMHLLGNMLTLWVFGSHVEDRLGHFRYLIFYLLCGLAASVGHVFSDPQSTAPCVGASGAIAGILGASLVLIPRAWVLTLVPFFIIFRVVRIPAFIFLILWFAMQIFLAHTQAYAEMHIAVMTHIVGFLFGLMGILMAQKPRTRKGKTSR